ncbi:hypothetical protein CTM88_13665 [Photobacterium aquimaris]|uniref:Uncharacterized protein n=1 Tax=Photobacterium aquimaris TaxID=512643 RepID=A0A2T3IIK9_9GAMM|nr:hypothetical protein [Photobacterium aquimaris]OBU15782.1 hypothetical protein AYY20_07500 [Photobacterium aquimaris]PSU28176.1 hypothetical protein CTM88_13665 [Photobacterium aquimaris]
MGWLSSSFSAACSAVASVCSAAVSVCGSIGRSVGNIVSNIAPKLMMVVGPTNKLNTLLAVADAVIQMYSILKPDEKIQDIGDKAIQASEEGISMDKFDDFDEYMASLRNFEIDPERSEKTDELTKQLTGIAVVTQGLAEKLNIDGVALGNVWTLPALNPQVFTPERIKVILDNTSNISNVVRYFENSLSPQIAYNVEKELVAAEKQLSPDRSDEKIYKLLDSTCDDIEKKSEQIIN